MSKQTAAFFTARFFFACLTAALILATSYGASGNQKNKKDKTADASAQPSPMPPIPDTEQIEQNIGQMLAAFQLDNVNMMHKYYSDNATWVSSDYEPPVIGWQNYVPLYERSIAAFQGMQLNRRNTLIFTRGDVAWAAYQWEFDSTFNGQPYTLRGQTTLIFNKVAGNWLIVHNHTSQVYPAAAPAQRQQTPPSQSAPRP